MSKTPARYKVSRRPRANTRPLHSITPSSETSHTTHAELGPHCEHNLCDDNSQDYLDGGQVCSICVVVMATKISRIDKMTVNKPQLQYRTQCFTIANLHHLIKKTNSLITVRECLMLRCTITVPRCVVNLLSRRRFSTHWRLDASRLGRINTPSPHHWWYHAPSPTQKQACKWICYEYAKYFLSDLCRIKLLLVHIKNELEVNFSAVDEWEIY
jgi:hypothetical protein